jgi:hypothetical protein
MQATSDLSKLHRAVDFRLDKLLRITAIARSQAGSMKGILIGHCVIELDNLIIGANRMFVGSCLTQARTANGVTVVASSRFSSQQEVGAFILRSINGTKFTRMGSPLTISRRDEPTLRSPRDVSKVMVAAAASNLASVQNALALNSSVFGEISAMRNFYAHRNADTMDRARRVALTWGIARLAHVDEVANLAKANRPVPVLDEWVVEVRDFMRELFY